MSNERKTHRDIDAAVADAYGDLANETVPEHLNNKILAMAKAATGQPRKTAWNAVWMKPIAWAATLGLSLAVVLQLTEPSQAPLVPDTSSAAESLREEMQLKSSQVVDEAEAAARMRAGPNQVERRQDSNIVVAVDAASLGATEAAEDRDAERRHTPAAAPAAAKTEAKRFADAAISSADSVQSLSQEARLEPTCPAAQRQSADDWSDCILALRKQGQEQLAEAEVEFFEATFPDFPANK